MEEEEKQEEEEERTRGPAEAQGKRGVQAVRDPEESWWVKDAALQTLGHGSADQIAPLYRRRRRI